MPQTQTIAGKASLRVISEIPDLSMLQDVLTHVAKEPVTVSKDQITCSEADLDLVRPVLAEIGIEVGDPEILSAEDPTVTADPVATDPAAAPAAPAVDPAAAPAAPAVAAAAVVAAAPAPAVDPAPAVAPAAPVAGADCVTEDQLYDCAEADINQAGEVAGVLSASAKDTHWVVIAGGSPIARISLASQPKSAALAGYFASQSYWDTVVQAFQKKGIAATLRSLKAEVFTAKPVKASEGPDVAGLVSAALDKYRTCLSMAFQASSKNLTQNRLKAAAYEVCQEAGVEDPEAVVEAIFNASEGFLEDMDGAAAEYMSMDESGLQATGRMLAKLTAQAASKGSVAAPARSSAAAEMRASLVAGNMPVTVTGTEGLELPVVDPAAVEPAPAQDGEVVPGVSASLIRASLGARYLG